MASRYAVQERFAPWGADGQARLSAATAVVVGVGALGGVSAGLLARAGVGRLRLIDHDHPSIENLHRQVLYTERDVAKGLTKVQAAKRFLTTVNSEVVIEAIDQELTADNAAGLLAGADVVLDGLDAPLPRYHLNRACLDLAIPWVHAGVVGSGGQLLVVRPGLGPCFECFAPAFPPPKPKRSVASHGVIPPLPTIMAGLQASEALKLLMGQDQTLQQGMLLVELWPPSMRTMNIDATASNRCTACQKS